ncbi:MAG: mechanosensitive ion channel family protein [Kiloniellales bacterium]
MNEATLELIAGLTQVVTRYGLDVVGAFVLLVVGWILAGWARRAVLGMAERIPGIDATLQLLLSTLARYVVLAFVAIAVLAQFGVQTTSIIALFGAAGIAIALALQGTLSNIAAGIMLLFLRPFMVGEYIDAEGVAGTVDEIGLFTTQLRTYDGVYVMVPNAQLWNRSIKNYSRLPTRRLDIEVGIAYHEDIAGAFAALGAMLEEDERVLRDPPFQVMVTELADSAVTLNVRCWTRAGAYWDLRFDLLRRCKEVLDAEGISIPFPQRDVHLFEAAREAPA